MGLLAQVRRDYAGRCPHRTADSATMPWPGASRGGAEDAMRTYDPTNGMVYRHMGRPTDPHFVPVTSTSTVNKLPRGYANGSPRTYLGRTRLAPPANALLLK